MYGYDNKGEKMSLKYTLISSFDSRSSLTTECDPDGRQFLFIVGNIKYSIKKK